MKILIVEDEWKTLKGLSNLIAELGGEYEIAGQARSGEEGIRMAMELRPDIIITDIRMNGMTGLEMMKPLNEEKLACRYIILSGYAEFQYAKEAISLGSMDYLLKPITKEILEESLIHGHGADPGAGAVHAGILRVQIRGGMEETVQIPGHELPSPHTGREPGGTGRLGADRGRTGTGAAGN